MEVVKVNKKVDKIMERIKILVRCWVKRKIVCLRGISLWVLGIGRISVGWVLSRSRRNRSRNKDRESEICKNSQQNKNKNKKQT